MKQNFYRARKLAVLTAVGTAVGVWLLTGTTGASNGQAAAIEHQFAGAETVVVAAARSVSARWEENDYGDRIIVSRIELDVEETLKGAPTQAMSLDVDGGTLDDLTLHVSGLHVMEPGERAVLFLNPGRDKVHTPHLRGQGILVLDDQNIVKGRGLTLDDIRAKARGLGN